MNETNVKTYLVPQMNLPILRAKLDKLVRKAAKLGTVEISYSLGAEKDIPYLRVNGGVRKIQNDVDRKYAEAHNSLVFIRFQEVTVSGTTPRLAGWAFVATLQHLTDGEGAVINLLRTVPGFEGQLPEQYRTATPENCDHCHKFIRTRKETFVVQHEDGTWKQVGRNCTQDFLGGKDPHAVASSLDCLLRAFDEASTLCEEGSMGSGERLRWSMSEFLAVVTTLVRADGWCSRGKARNTEGLTATADLALYYLNPPWDAKAHAEWRKFVDARPITDDDKATAEKALDFAREDLSARTTRSDYEHNLYVATIQATVDAKLCGIAASLMPYYLREVERKVVKEAELRRVAESKHLGQVGERLILDVQVAKIITVGEFNQFGPSYLHKLITTDGDLVIWFSSNSDNNLKPGEKYTVKASVKKHDIRDNVKQTVVTRLTELNPEEAEKERAKAARAAIKAAKKAAVEAEVQQRLKDSAAKDW